MNVACELPTNLLNRNKKKVIVKEPLNALYEKTSCKPHSMIKFFK